MEWALVKCEVLEKNCVITIARLAKHSNRANAFVAMPLWELLSAGTLTTFEVQSHHANIESMGIWVPDTPAFSLTASVDFADALILPMYALKDPWPSINASVFWLRLALAQGDLSMYALTFKTFVSDRWNEALAQYPLAEHAWRSISSYLIRRYSTLVLRVDHELAFHFAVEEFVRRGLPVHVTMADRTDDVSYQLIASPWAPVEINAGALTRMFSKVSKKKRN
ncbi:hypothetical protein [Paraburkholderia sp. CI3]|uniref:hypothetical protein n=1 Tax=Paraburkholderia sp. CI3 TaxID=2991060 RepID=UPI003D22E5A8